MPSGLRAGCRYAAALAALLLAMAGCQQRPRIRLATTTSTESSGLLDALLPPFTEKCGIEVDVIAVGTGKAIKLAENGDVDLILVHAPAAEIEFVEAGFGIGRRGVMHNEFTILGPSADPAGIRGMKDAPAALARIADSASAFVSRGDDSGTHMKERSLWKDAGVEPSGGWYLEAGQGMGAVLVMAHEKRGYTISDRGTYLALRFKGTIDLDVLVEGDERLMNPYGIIAVNPARHPHVRHGGAMKLIEWVTSLEGQEIIGEFRLGGERLFHPDVAAVRPGGAGE